MTVAKAATIMKCQEKLKQERSTVTAVYKQTSAYKAGTAAPIVWAGTTFEAPALRLLGSGGAELPEAREARLCVCAAAVKSIPKFCAFVNDMGANPRWTMHTTHKYMLIYRALEREFLEQNPDCARPPADGLYYFERVDFFARFVDFHEPQHGERSQRELFQGREKYIDYGAFAGKGGFAEVRLATIDNLAVALKRVHADADPVEAANALRAEANMLTSLGGEHVVMLLESGWICGKFAFGACRLVFL